MVERRPFKASVLGSSPSGPSKYMRGYLHPTEIREKCQNLRRRGYSLNEIVSITKIPKTTVHSWVSRDVILSPQARHRIIKRIISGCIKGNTSPNRASLQPFSEPKKWNPDLVAIVAHFLFDGYPRGRTAKSDGYVYCSRNLSQLNRMKKIMKRTFNLDAHPYEVGNGVIRHNYYSVKLAKWINNVEEKLLTYIEKAPIEEKRAFLKAFFDDEGSINFYHNRSRRVNGCQYSLRVLKIIQNLLKNFDIISQINKRETDIYISGRENLIKFKNEVNFSSNIFINPNRKGSYWKFKIDKRTILKKAISSYKKF